ncbi:YbaY family lipoprotein [Pseudomonas juntendi]|uniref:YbaY family lipoprotein n=1 Tax=Pseudomonas juntendi TaxID=2666183 RepID=UPI00345444B2
MDRRRNRFFQRQLPASLRPGATEPARRVPCRRAGRQHAELRLQCAGVLPIKLQLACDLSQLDPRGSYVLAVRIEQNGQLQFINTTHHAVNPHTLSGTERVVVDNVATPPVVLHD